jgi:hypothetical protein
MVRHPHQAHISEEAFLETSKRRMKLGDLNKYNIGIFMYFRILTSFKKVPGYLGETEDPVYLCTSLNTKEALAVVRNNRKQINKVYGKNWYFTRIG